MKKIAIICTLILLASSSAFAAASVDMDLSAKSTTGLVLYGHPTSGAAATATNNPTSLGKTSTGVGIAAISGISGYSIIAQHMNGTKAYGSSHDSTSMFQTIADVAVGSETTTPTVSNSGAFPASAWRAM